MNTKLNCALATLLLMAAAWPTNLRAEAWTLETLCAEEFGDWDATTLTCRFTRDYLTVPTYEVLIIREGETLDVRDSSDYNYFNGVVYNAGTIRLYDADAIFTSLINSGTLDHDAGDPSYVVALGNGRRFPSVNTGTVLNGARLYVENSLDNAGTIVNEGVIQNGGFIDNRGSIDNGDGLVENFDRGVIRNYRCPGSRGVVTAGASNIVNEGRIEYVTGPGC